MAIHLLEAYPTANTNMNLQMDQQSKHNEAWEGRRGGLVACASQLASLLRPHWRTTVAMMLITLAWQVKGKKKRLNRAGHKGSVQLRPQIRVGIW